MRSLIVSDIHSNLTAFEAVLAHAGKINRAICLGDLVGYGPQPNECIELLRTLPELTCILGNHDAAALGFIDIQAFNHEARKALLVQTQLLIQDSLDFLELLPIRAEVDGVTLAHGSPRNPIWEYVVNDQIASANLTEFETAGCLVGHSHVPCIFYQEPDRILNLLLPGSGDRWQAKGKFLLNPGSVGQPRDHNPRASFVIWDDEENTWEFCRVAYDVAFVQKKILDLGIPARHAARLRLGV